MTTTGRRDCPVGWLLAWCITLTGVVLWPFFLAATGGLAAAITGEQRESLILRDMVVPGSMSLNDLATGTDGLARAVPQDSVLAFLSPVIAPPVVVGILMCGAGVAGSVGASLLARRYGAQWPGQLLAAAVVLVNPYLAERLLQGHWSVVAAGMLLPVIALSASSMEWPPGRRWPIVCLMLSLIVCALTPTGLILAVITAVVASGARRRTLLPLALAALLSLPWLVPSLSGAASTVSDSLGAALFAARAEPLVGTLGALAGLGGIWNADAVPEHRMAWAGAVMGTVATAVALTLAVRASRAVRSDVAPAAEAGCGDGVLRRLAFLAAAAVLLPWLLSTGVGLTILGTALENLPGAGLLRDTQKFVVLALPAVVILLSRVDVLVVNQARVATGLATKVATAMVGLMAILQVPALPVDLAALRPVQLDSSYDRAVEAVSEAGAGRTLLWPPGSYRQVPVNAGGAGSDTRIALDPLLKMLPGSPVDPGYLIVDGKLVDGNTTTMRLLNGLASGDDDLAIEGIDLVLVNTTAGDEDNTGIPTLPRALINHELVWAEQGWQLYRVR